MSNQDKNNVIKISGLDCANCARELEEKINKLNGVNASVDFLGGKVYCECSEENLQKVKDICNNFEEVKVVEETLNSDTIKIEGLCCANCARELEEELNKISGLNASINFMNKQITLSTQNNEAYKKGITAIKKFGVKIVEGERQNKSVIKEYKKDIIAIILSVIFFIPAVVLDKAFANQTIKIVAYCLYGAAYLSIAYTVLINTFKNIIRGKIFDENFLMTIASLGAVGLGIVGGDGFFEGVAVMLLYRIGELLQGIAVGSSRNSISSLMDLKSEKATLLVGGESKVVKPEELKVGDLILIKAGEKIPVDCIVKKGQSLVDFKSLNGEPIPVETKIGGELLSGGVNKLSGVLECEVLREYKNSAVAKILELVENSTAKKSKPEKFITKFAKYYTPTICILAFLTASLVPTIICLIQSTFVWKTYSEWIYRALGFLVISCPCALVISVPLSYFYGIGRCAKQGILVKGSTCLDELALAKLIAFDKTGTITKGEFCVKSSSNDKALRLAAAVEKFSTHPVSHAFSEIESEYKVTNVEEVAGRGIKGIVDGKVLLCGNLKLLQENNVQVTPFASVSTLIYVALNDEYLGVIEVDDQIKEGIIPSIAKLKKQGIEKTVMLTGDSKERGEAIAKEVKLDAFYGGLLPDGKIEKAEELKKEGKLIYVGDGINDAPVMTCADCGISMGGVGSDAAIEASDIVLVTDNITLIPTARKVAKTTRSIVLQNIIGSLLVKGAIMALDLAIPAFPLIISIVADVGVMLVAVVNSMRTSLIKN